jgi:hypothetical protein
VWPGIIALTCEVARDKASPGHHAALKLNDKAKEATHTMLLRIQLDLQLSSASSKIFCSAG